MMKFRENEDAVSPVIGVILMVAITVILAAVIAAFVFGMAGNIQSTKNVAATATQQGQDRIIVTYHGGPDAGDLLYLRVSVTPSSGSGINRCYYVDKGTNEITSVTTMADSDVQKASPGKIPAGSSWEYNTVTYGKDHVVVAAHFADGSDQVILDTFV